LKKLAKLKVCLASEFLLEKGFNMQNLFREGVPYLSRREVAKAEKKETEKADGLAISDIDLGPEDVEMHAFMAKVKHRINEWCKARVRYRRIVVFRLPLGNSTNAT
jgi:CAF1 family ribonuclease